MGGSGPRSTSGRGIFFRSSFQLPVGPFEGSLFNTLPVLRTLNPPPHMFYFSGTDVEVAGRLRKRRVKLETAYSTPSSGGHPAQGKTPEEDQAMETELLSDEKELAEHNMLVDLGRNDLGKISRFVTVQVEKSHTIERFSHVMHIGSTVRGELREDKDADAIEAVLPAGTLPERLIPGLPADCGAGEQQGASTAGPSAKHRLHREYGHLYHYPDRLSEERQGVREKRSWDHGRLGPGAGI